MLKLVLGGWHLDYSCKERLFLIYSQGQDSLTPGSVKSVICMYQIVMVEQMVFSINLIF